MPNFAHDHYTAIWTRQLLQEFEDICWQHQVHLPTPTIELFEATHRLGEWRAASQTIRINRELLVNQPWPVTINVLKHEMAHQLCGAWGDPDAGHGPRFAEACLRLGVPPAYQTARGDSPALFADLASESQLVNEGRRFFSKVEKLLALGRSSNANEAALAMKKANELIEKYNLKLAANDAGRRYRRAIINTGKRRIPAWQRAIAALLRDFFFVKVVQSAVYDPLLDQRHKTIELFGLAENVAVAEYCYHFLERELDVLWQRNRACFAGGTVAEKNSYSLGVINGFHEKLHGQRPQPAPCPATAVSNSALIVAADQGLQEFIALSHPRLRTVRHAGPRINRNAFQRGTADGRDIVLRKGVTTHQGNQGRLVTEGH